MDVNHKEPFRLLPWHPFCVAVLSGPLGLSPPLPTHPPTHIVSPEYVITMYDTKTRELRWNGTYLDYSALALDPSEEYGESLGGSSGLTKQGMSSLPFLCRWKQRLLPGGA